MATEFAIRRALNRQPVKSIVIGRGADANGKVQKPVALRTLRRPDLARRFIVGRSRIDNPILPQPHQRRLATHTFKLSPNIGGEAGYLIGVGFIVGAAANFRLPGVAKLVKEDRHPAPNWHLAVNPDEVLLPIANACFFASLSVPEIILDPHTIGPRANFEDHELDHNKARTKLKSETRRISVGQRWIT